ncbi:phage portal protein [Deinococcus marmoris]|uniref:Transfer Agent portal protein n=1 Tax=Deinococcus marmoris TaxID=249408 RepID=A0A1U7P2Z6_9DEIO|nr:phage portal protein [Deinococcus marmoris]OLV19541.1 Transfer Agent portal protein [Deinococcus marmoris]
MNLWERMNRPLWGREEKSEQPHEVKGVTITTESNNAPYIPVAAGVRPPSLSGNITLSRAVSAGLEQSSWLQTALTKKARAAASVPLMLEHRSRKGWIRQEGGKDPAGLLVGLLATPHPHLSMQDILERMVMHLEITGNALLHRVKTSDGRTLELEPIDPSTIKPKRTDLWITGYEYRDRRGKLHTLPLNEVSHFMYQNPADLHWGLSPAKSAALAVDTDLEAQRWNRSVIGGGARPAGVVLLDGALDEDEQQLAYDQVNAQISGASGASRFMVFGGATKVESFGWNSAEMDFLAGRKFSRDEICAVLGVPSILVSQGQDATYSNMEAAKRHLWEDTLVPLLQDIASTLGKDLLADFQLDPKKYRIVPDLTNVPALRENEATRLKNISTQAGAAALLLRGGQFTPESIAEAVGLNLVTVEQAVAVTALKSLSPAARAHLEVKHALELDELTPAQCMNLVRRIKEETA